MSNLTFILIRFKFKKMFFLWCFSLVYERYNLILTCIWNQQELFLHEISHVVVNCLCRRSCFHIHNMWVVFLKVKSELKVVIHDKKHAFVWRKWNSSAKIALFKHLCDFWCEFAKLLSLQITGRMSDNVHLDRIFLDVVNAYVFSGCVDQIIFCCIVCIWILPSLWNVTVRETPKTLWIYIKVSVTHLICRNIHKQILRNLIFLLLKQP